jgi:amidophosphoribosyltransferase
LIADEDHLNDECGVVGVYGVPEASEAVYMALYALQHRGQESTGIVTSDEGRFHHHREMGLVSDVFAGDRLTKLPGAMGVGHNRYSTKGASSLRNAQPIWVTYHGGDLALAHNGQLVNAVGLRRGMEESGSIFQTTSDSEVMVHLIAASRAPSFEGRLMGALHQVEGAFAITALTADAVYAARDTHGFRPLVIGKLARGWIVASETCALDIVEAEFVREVDPGEVIALDDRGIRTVGRLPAGPLHKCVFELIYFSRPDSVVFGESVDRVRRQLGRKLAEEQPADADCVIAVPDSSNSAALGYSEVSGIPFELGLIRNHYIGRTFIRPGQILREAGVRVKYNAVRPILEGKRVAVVDDSVVRGTTSGKLVSLLRRAGVKEVHLRVASPPITGPCLYGIDTPMQSELVAANHSLEEIRDTLKVDSLGYLSMEGLRASVKAPSEHCYACFTGEYPVGGSEEEIRRREGRSPGIMDYRNLTAAKETAKP